MLTFNKFMQTYHLFTTNNPNARQNRLIFNTTYELISLCLIIISLYALSKVWYMVAMLSIACALAMANLWVLIRTNNPLLGGHVITMLVLLTTIIANYLVGGTGTPYSIWFYVIPVIAASLVGWHWLIAYSGVSVLMIIFFGTIHFQPFYQLPSWQMTIIVWANHLIAFMVIVTTLNGLMRENRMYEKLLHEQNYLLNIEKNKFQYLSRYDQLTNLPNRQFFMLKLQEEINALAADCHLTVFFMDLDNLKYVNDRFGHVAGDHLLRQTAKRLQICFRDTDFIARLGGDEFTAIVIHSQEDTIPQTIVTRIMSEFNKPIPYHKTEYSCSISIGLATCPSEGKTVSELMSKADLTMYMAKKNGHPMGAILSK